MEEIDIIKENYGEFVYFLVLSLPWVNLVFVIYAIVNVIKRKLTLLATLLWIFFILYVPFFGAIVSLIVVRKRNVEPEAAGN